MSFFHMGLNVRKLDFVACKQQKNRTLTACASMQDCRLIGACVLSYRGGGGGNLRVILVRVCGPIFETYPNHIPCLRKK